MSKLHTLTEPEVRALRDKVYGRPQSQQAADNNWEGCRENWLKPESVQWLIEAAQKPLTDYTEP